MWDGKAFAGACSTEASPWTLLEELAEAWAGSRNPGGFPVDAIRLGESALGRPFPSALRRWYLQFANHPRLSNFQQDQLKPPDRLQSVDGVVTFLVENQGVWRVAIRESDFGSEDPPVVWTSDWGKGARWEIASDRFSRFALQWALYATSCNGEFGAAGSVARVDTAKLFSATTPIPLPPIRLFGGGALRFRAADDLLIQEQDFEAIGDCDYILIAALTQSACDFATSLIDVDWDSRSGE